jgi:hypothetical protein
LPIQEIDDDAQHDRIPIFDRDHPNRSWFQIGFVKTENSFVATYKRSRFREPRGRPKTPPTPTPTCTGIPPLIHVNDLLVARPMIFGSVRVIDHLEGSADAVHHSSGVSIMFRKTIIALTAILAFSVMAPSEASAWRGGWGWGGWGWGLGAIGLGIGLGIAATAPYGYGYGYGYPYGAGAYGYPYGYAGYGGYYGYGGCYLVTQRVWTGFGWRWGRVQVCG